MNYIKQHIDKDTVFLVSEKVYLKDAVLQTLIHKLHLEQKRKSFHDTEILDKELQLMNSMFCLSEEELYEELQILGNVTKIWQSYNFMGFVITKNSGINHYHRVKDKVTRSKIKMSFYDFISELIDRAINLDIDPRLMDPDDRYLFIDLVYAEYLLNKDKGNPHSVRYKELLIHLIKTYGH